MPIYRGKEYSAGMYSILLLPVDRKTLWHKMVGC